MDFKFIRNIFAKNMTVNDNINDDLFKDYEATVRLPPLVGLGVQGFGVQGSLGLGVQGCCGLV